jgi:sugar lactone lactonase YvrE
MGSEPRGRARLITLAILFVALAAAAVWLWLRLSRVDRLEPGWTAVVRVIAGDGIAGMRDGDGTRARFTDPFGVAAGPDGSIYVADAGDAPRIRRVGLDGSVSTIAGSTRGYADGIGPFARFDTPSGLAIDAQGSLYVADTGNNAIRRITPDRIVSTMAGGGGAGHLDAAGTMARFNGPIGIAVDRTGRLIVADTYNDRIRAIEVDGSVATIAGDGQPGYADGPAGQAKFHTPCGVAVDSAGNIYVADTGNGLVRLISPAGQVSTIPAVGLSRPLGIAVSGDGTVYVTEDRGRIVEITPGAGERTLAGSRPGFADGPGSAARFRTLAGIALAGPGRLFVTDPRNALVRMVAEPSRLDLRPPAPPGIDPGFDDATFGREPLLWPLAPMEGPFEITGTLGELRGGEGTERFHSGIDVFSPQGEPVRAVRSGAVVSPISTGAFGTLNEWVRIDSLTYVHMRVGRTRENEILDSSRFVATYDEAGELALVRVKRGARFGSGEAIGTINAFNHVHLNVGWPGEERNPLDFRLLHFEDTVRPRIALRGIRLFGQDGQQLTRRQNGRVLVSGIVRIVVDAWDQVDGNLPRRRLGLYRLGYQVFFRDRTPAPGFETPRDTIRFDRLAGESDAAGAIYASGSGIPYYGRRRTRFLYIVSNTLRDGVASVQGWDTTTLAPGDYMLRVIAADVQGNDALANRELPVRILPQSNGPADGAR